MLLELVVGFAVASIMLLCVWSSFNSAMNSKKNILEKKESYKILHAIEKELSRNVEFEEISYLAGSESLKLNSSEIKNVININFIEQKLGGINDFSISFSQIDKESEYMSIVVFKGEYSIGVNKFKCIKVK
ncbi:MAG: hypothetical protein ACRC6T_04100 [Sarcina sp.]